MRGLSRREFVTGAVTGAVLAARKRDAFAADSPTIGLGFSLYGMKSLPIGEALAACREIGYGCVELPVQADWPLDVSKLTEADRRKIADSLARNSLRLSSLMENLQLVVDEARHRNNQERLKRCGELAHDLAPEHPPVIETILGGKPDQWDTMRDSMADRLADWARIAEAAKTIIAIKPHVGGAMHRPEHALWLVEQVNSRWIRPVYDYSHYQLRTIDMEKSIQQLVPQSVFIHVKDARGDADHVQFLLPGEGTIDYVRYLELVARAGYRGDIVVEVSGQIHGRSDYDPIAAARKSYQPLAAAFERANVKRG